MIVPVPVHCFSLTLNISATSGSIVTKFYLNYHWGWGKAAIGFGPDRIGTLVSMATESSHRVTDEALIAETVVWPNFFLMNIFFDLKGSKLFIIIMEKML